MADYEKTHTGHGIMALFYADQDPSQRLPINSSRPTIKVILNHKILVFIMKCKEKQVIF